MLNVSGQASKTGTQPYPSKSKQQQQQNETTKNRLQMKEQGKNLQDQINEEEICNLPEKEFRMMIDDDP